jgi:hypothetical protein
MNDIGIEVTDDGYIVVSMDGIEPRCWVKMNEDEALALAMVILGQIIVLRKRRNMQ